MQRKKLYQHTIKGKSGQYQAPSTRYSRKQCLLVMLGLDPDLKVIFVKQGPRTIEKACRSPKRLVEGRSVWHFYAAQKLESVEVQQGNASPK